MPDLDTPGCDMTVAAARVSAVTSGAHETGKRFGIVAKVLAHRPQTRFAVIVLLQDWPETVVENLLVECGHIGLLFLS